MGGYPTWGCFKYIPHSLAGATLVVPVTNYWWPSFPSNLSREVYKKQPLRDQWSLWVAHHIPQLLYWWMTQKWLLSSSLVEMYPEVFSIQDKEIVKKMSGILAPNQIHWPDGIFITKHPMRQRPNPSVTTPRSSPHGRPPMPVCSLKKEDLHQFDEQQQKEAERRAKFVYEPMIDNVPAAIVGLFGRKEYEQCAKDLYYFLQAILW